jgi:hypothetical protein
MSLRLRKKTQSCTIVCEAAGRIKASESTHHKSALLRTVETLKDDSSFQSTFVVAAVFRNASAQVFFKRQTPIY